MAFVYLVRCVDGSLYVGSTSDLERRVEMHNAGHGSSYTSRRRPVALVYAEEYDTIESAARRERQIKRWTTAKKEALRQCQPTSATSSYALLTDDGHFYRLDESGNREVAKITSGKNSKNMKVSATGSMEGDLLKDQSLSKI